MAKKITYLFGAGASKNALPIVNEIPQRIESLIEFLLLPENELEKDATFNDPQIPQDKSKSEFQLEMINSLKWMMIESHLHASIDTFAKKLTIKRKFEELEKLKIAMSVFFIFEQARNNVDYRYDAFYAALIDPVKFFPEHVNILTWNYDHQFELAYSEYSDQYELSANESLLNMRAKYANSIHARNGFSLFKLNGTTGLIADGGHNKLRFVPELNMKVDKLFIEHITLHFAAATYVKRIKSTLSFAWEQDTRNGIISQAIENTWDTFALVVIGYSFPFFNREIDREIIGAMTDLRKVYFQAPDSPLLIERFHALKDDVTGISLIPKVDIDQFLLPNEL